ncbi:hypothetical protein BDB00DRAFT_848116 [Zychaea mexicana]|uniref:uncharacterized protein n=1 Tax=Zychaea mexicana TaxID=64656 RepID=UPI0022FE26F5|nr:uncharacterized protein BDB00DRAFT_848116 [Zychaea mexicana]KAI9488457.1 hypothetical protein BDB00DRAFT_848116 [Zychaea mexicana]
MNYILFYHYPPLSASFLHSSVMSISSFYHYHHLQLFFFFIISYIFMCFEFAPYPHPKHTSNMISFFFLLCSYIIYVFLSLFAQAVTFIHIPFFPSPYLFFV